MTVVAITVLTLAIGGQFYMVLHFVEEMSLSHDALANVSNGLLVTYSWYN